MSTELLILYILIPMITALIAVIGRGIMQRLSSLEERMLTRISEESVRIIVSDKLDPLKEDITEIKDTLNKILINMRRK